MARKRNSPKDRGHDPMPMFGTEGEGPASQGPPDVAAPAVAERWAVNIADGDEGALLIMYGLMGPLVGYPGWGDDPQFWAPHKATITMLRLAHALEIARTGMATEYETMLYVSSATLAAPPTQEWYHIYMYLFHRCMGEKAQGLDIPDPTLDSQEEELLRDLRRWIFKHQWDHLKAKLKAEGEPDRARTDGDVLGVRMERLL